MAFQNVVIINNCATIAFAQNTSHKFIGMKLMPKNVFKQPEWALGLNLLNFRKSLTARILSAIHLTTTIHLPSKPLSLWCLFLSRSRMIFIHMNFSIFHAVNYCL